MPKVISSPVKRFPGTVTLADPLTFPQSFAIEDAILAVKELGEKSTLLRYNAAWLAGILPCVEKWAIEGIPSSPTLDTFPTTPRTSSAKLIAWLVDEVMELYKEGDEVPND